MTDDAYTTPPPPPQHMIPPPPSGGYPPPPPGYAAPPPAPGYAAPPAPGYAAPPAPGYAAPPPPGYAGPYYGAPPLKNPATAKNWMNITALILSLATLITGFTAIGGIIFGHLGRSAAKRGEANNGGVGLAGLIIGYVFTILGILTFVGLMIFGFYISEECDNDPASTWCESSYESDY